MIPLISGRIEAAPQGGGTPLRGLTRSSDATREGLAVDATRTCTIDGCGRKLMARGMCSRHYRRWRLENDPGARERDNETQRARRARTPEREVEYRRQYRERHHEREKARMVVWREENRDQTLLDNWLRRRRGYGLPDDVVDKVAPDEVFERDNGTCRICGNAVDPDLVWPDPRSGTIDHVVPVCDPTAEHSYANTQLAHFRCNQEKNASLPRELRALAAGGAA